MSKLAAALAWAARGFPVFPLVENGKEPAFDGSWYDLSTTDEATIRAYWTDPVLRTERNYNIGVDCTGRVVIDIDVKDGKDGFGQYNATQGGYDTLIVRTPSGGYHLYFEGPDSSNAPLASAIDVRSHHGYVVAPGSYTVYEPGKSAEGWYELVRDVEPAWIPYTLERRLAPPDEQRSNLADVSLEDTPARIEAGIRFLQSAPVAIEGQGGDNRTFQTAARMIRELAVSPAATYQLMAEHWNPRCQPPWDLDELAAKVENAANYGTAEIGRVDPEFVYKQLGYVEPPPSVFEQQVIDWGNALDAEEFTPRPWLIDRMLMISHVTLILAAGSVGKSSLGLILAAHVAQGLDFAGFKCHAACKVLVYNGEDDVMEQSKRLYAICMLYGFHWDTVRRRVILMSEDDVDLRLVRDKRNPTIDQAMYDQLRDKLADPEVGLFIGDPLVDLHDIDENDSAHMNLVMKVLKRLSREANVATLVMHHTNKAGTEKQENRIGNMDIARGSSGIVYKARVAFTMLNASDSDAADYGMQDGERNLWVRMDDAKMNLTLASGKPVWFRREGVKIPGGDNVGVLRQVELSKSHMHMTVRVAEKIIAHLSTIGSGSIPLGQLVAFLQAAEPYFANQTTTAVRGRIEQMFVATVDIRGHRLRLERGADGQDKPLLVLT